MASEETSYEATLEAQIRAKRSEMEQHQTKLNSLQLELNTLQDMAKSPERVGETPQIMDRIETLPSEISSQASAANEASSRMAEATADLEELRQHSPQERDYPGREEAARQHKDVEDQIEMITHGGEGLDPEPPEHPPSNGLPPTDQPPPTQAMTGIPSHQEGGHSHTASAPDPFLTVAIAATAIHVAGRAAADAHRESKERDHAQAEQLYDRQLKENNALVTQIKEQHELANREMKALDLNSEGQKQFQLNQFEMAAHQMNELYTAQDKQRKDHGIDIPERNTELQDQRFKDTKQLCEGQVETEIKQREDKMLQDYAQLQPDQAKVDTFRQQLATTDHSSWVQEQAPLLQRQTFPQVAEQGPLLGPAPPQPQPQQQQQQPGPGTGPGL